MVLTLDICVKKLLNKLENKYIHMLDISRRDSKKTQFRTTVRESYTLTGRQTLSSDRHL